jgi:hypothetical protein
MNNQTLLRSIQGALPAAGWRAGLLLAAIPLLASCHDDDVCCFHYTPVEVNKGLVAGNFTHNGHTSVIATSTVVYNSGLNAGNLKAYLSAGAGSFASPTLTADGNDPLYLVAADLNGDGFLDVVSASYLDGSINVFVNNAQSPGSFTSPVTLQSPGVSQLAVGDMNGDGMPDIVAADFNVSLFVQSSPGVFAAPVTLYSGGANWVAVGDLNHDGSADVALTDAVGVKILFHTGAAGSTTFAAPVSVFTQTPNDFVQGANIVAIADINGDGYNDLVITDPGPDGGMAPTVSVLLQDPTHPGTFLAAVAYPTPPQNLALSITVTDVNGDGLPDIVIGGSSQVAVLLQDASHPGAFLAATAYDAPSTTEVTVADVNGDGLPDIVVNMGPTQSNVNGVITNAPGVLLQSASAHGTFSAVQALP